jgi:peptide/nickel transport system ATP-binding protein
MRRMLELLSDVRLDAAVLNRYPHQLSGGQKQRVALARAFAAEPRLILCDEVVSALDVSVQASILELLARLAAEKGTALVFVTHDLAVVRSISDRVCVMRDGVICEMGPTRQLFLAPTHPYTQALLDAVPSPEVASLTGPATA